MALPQTLESLYAPIAPQLEAVKATVQEAWRQALQLVHGPGLEPPEMTGKLLRPALCLLSAGAIGEEGLDGFVPMAAGFETMHLAALVHDDVVDKAEVRRGATSLNALWNDHAAVLGGDYLVARSTTLLTQYDSCALIADVANAVRQMSEGELRNLGLDPERYTEDDCLLLAQQKTASLFTSTCTGPALLRKHPAQGAFQRYGLGFGTAFQLIDDILDLSQPEAKLGKPSCGDIAEAKKTLPILYMRRALEGPDAERLAGLMGGSLDDHDRSWIAGALERSGARKATETVAREHVAQAAQALEELPATPFRESMAGLLEFVMIRGS